MQAEMAAVDRDRIREGRLLSDVVFREDVVAHKTAWGDSPEAADHNLAAMRIRREVINGTLRLDFEFDEDRD